MKILIQNLLLAIYKVVRKTGLLSRGPGQALYNWFYWRYKNFLEAKDILLLKPYVAPGSLVIDVGANIGFFAVYLADWMGPKGRLIAIEPEDHNIGQLRRNLARRNLEKRVQIVEGVAAESNGTLYLKLNLDNPSDHRLAQTGSQVKAHTLDSLITSDETRHISLIKIDVQGAESRVLAGASQIMAQHRPVLFMEVDDQALREMNDSAEQLLHTVRKMNYQLYTMENHAVTGPWPVSHILPLCTGGIYCDVLCLPTESQK